MDFHIRKGVDIRLAGTAKEEIQNFASSRFLICPTDFRWLKPRLLIAPGSSVNVGTPLFCSKEDERIVIVSPVQGEVMEVIRGNHRAIEAIVIQADSSPITFANVSFPEPTNSSEIAELLIYNGLWPFLRQRPFATIPTPDTRPKALFVSCFDSAPLAPNFGILLKGKEEYFHEGIRRLHQLVGKDCPVHLCLPKGRSNQLFESVKEVKLHYFDGPHPAGNVGTQIHRIAPIDKGETVWFIHPQDVATIGRFFLTHELSFEKRIALTGPCAENPCYYTFPYGTDLSALLNCETTNAQVRKISGNVLTGNQLTKYNTLRFYDTQLTLLPEGGERELLGWLLPNFKKWSLSHTFLSWLFQHHIFAHNTSLQGGRRNFVMTDVYEKVFPFEILPLQLMKACLTEDIEQMEELGIYEVDDEDFALCEVVCPSKMECQKIIREGLYKIKMENQA